jgi:hypothetical protein
MPPYFKHSAVPRGVQKVQSHKPKPFFYGLKKATQSYLHSFVPQSWCSSAPEPPEPISRVFETRDCIWYYGTIYVKESVAVEKIQEHTEQHVEELQHQMNEIQELHQLHNTYKQKLHQEQPQTQHVDYDDDAESTTSSGNGSTTVKFSRNVGKQNQLKFLKDGMRVKHLLLVDRAKHEWNEWFATFDAETNRIIRTPDGVAFDTLRQFARIHSNEILSIDSTSTNVWSDANFQYQDDATGEWHPLSDLKKH